MKKSLLGISLISVSVLYGILAGIAILITMLLGGEILIALLASIVVLIIQFLISPWLTDLSMKWFYKAKFEAEIPEFLDLFIEETCKKHKIKYPRIGLIDDGAPNAFTYGRSKRDARIVLTRGVFDLLTEEETKAVVAHELGHIAHRDMMFMTMLQIIPLVLYAVYEMFTNFDRGNSDSDNNKLALVGYIAYILYIISQYIILWLSRVREYYADEFSANETKNPNSLAEALVKVGFGLSTSSNNTKHNVSKNNALGIFDSKTSKALVVSSNGTNISKDNIKNAMKWELWNPWAIWYEVNSTHPLISKRLMAISTLSKSFGQEPYITFDLEKPESYTDDFLLELLIKFAPSLIFIVTFIMLFIVKNNIMKVISIGGMLMTICMYFKFNRSHKNKNYKETTVLNLLGEVKVSDVTCIPCTLKGKIIGRGNPGCIFNEDFVIKDQTGIIFLDYNQPLNILNKIFAIFKSKEYFDKEVTIKGWYRRSPVPYVEIKEMDMGGFKKKIHTALISRIFICILFAIFFVIAFLR